MAATALADSFEAERTHLLSVGYRLTGSVTDAEDAVQESWFRLSSVDPDSIRDLRGWLTTVVGRICLDRLRSATSRRESYVGQWLPEPVVFDVLPSRTPDPLDAVVADEDNRLAALVVLDTLTPQQRVAFVLHDGFAVPFDEIAEILGATAESVRKLASRARKAVAAAPKEVPDEEHGDAVRDLLDALSSGDLERVVAALQPDAVLIADANGKAPAALEKITGAAAIAEFFFAVAARSGVTPLVGYRPAIVNGRLGLFTPGNSTTGELPRVVGFTVVDHKIAGAYNIANPEKLSGLRVPHAR